MHAADVLHGVFYLTSQPIAGFSPAASVASSEANTDSPLHRALGLLQMSSAFRSSPSPPSSSAALASGGETSSNTEASPSTIAEETYGIIGAYYPALELMALYTAAAMHDYQHPGRTNAFLVATHAPQVRFCLFDI